MGSSLRRRRRTRRPRATSRGCVGVSGDFVLWSKRKPSYSVNGYQKGHYFTVYVMFDATSMNVLSTISNFEISTTDRCYFSVFNILLVIHTVKVVGIFKFSAP